jgi:hypothetical protein
MAVLEQVLALYRERYFDLKVRHFHEKLVAEHGIKLCYSWVKAVLQGAGLITRWRKRGVHRQRRPRRLCPGCCCTSMAASIAGFTTTAGPIAAQSVRIW